MHTTVFTLFSIKRPEKSFDTGIVFPDSSIPSIEIPRKKWKRTRPSDFPDVYSRSDRMEIVKGVGWNNEWTI